MPSPALSGDEQMRRYQPYHAARADMLRRAGEHARAVDAYRRALARTENDTQRRFLERRLAEVNGALD